LAGSIPAAFIASTIVVTSVSSSSGRGSSAWGVEEDRVLGTGVAAELRPEGLALALEQLALSGVEANRPPAGLLPSRHPAPEAGG
jgi:hypothetical protein